MRISVRTTLAPAVTGGSLTIGGDTVLSAAATGTALVARRRGA